MLLALYLFISCNINIINMFAKGMMVDRKKYTMGDVIDEALGALIWPISLYKILKKNRLMEKVDDKNAAG